MSDAGKGASPYELVFGLVSPTGVPLKRVCEIIVDRLKVFGYATKVVKISEQVIPRFIQDSGTSEEPHVDRTNRLMTAGNKAREGTGRNDILAIGASRVIYDSRDKQVQDETEAPKPLLSQATLISQLKHPAEVKFLRDTYGQGFFLFGVTAPEDVRRRYLEDEKNVPPEEVDDLFERDYDEMLDHGQKVSETFHLSDFFIVWDENEGNLRAQIIRSLDLIFGNPFETPTFDEFAMFLAFSSALRSADLSRQVGAVVAKDDEVLAVGMNDAPAFGGGEYIRQYDSNKKKFVEKHPEGRDYQLKHDPNKRELGELVKKVLARASSDVRGIIEDVDVPQLLASDLWKKIDAALAAILERGPLSHLSEFGRAVHAEMEALLSCARRGVAVRNAHLYSTTFPCHNCAKHIVAAGLRRVVYVEPYMKSRAASLHSDSLEHSPPGVDHDDEDIEKVQLEPFVGVGPRRFLDFFSMSLGAGSRLVRKEKDGKVREWKPKKAELRMKLVPNSYLENEMLAVTEGLDSAEARFKAWKEPHGEEKTKQSQRAKN